MIIDTAKAAAWARGHILWTGAIIAAIGMWRMWDKLLGDGYFEKSADGQCDFTGRGVVHAFALLFFTVWFCILAGNAIIRELNERR